MQNTVNGFEDTFDIAGDGTNRSMTTSMIERAEKLPMSFE